ncbi:MAG: efflux RND transporter periplasmic adaptor subunit [Pseudomonadota bacterium]
MQISSSVRAALIIAATIAVYFVFKGVTGGGAQEDKEAKESSEAPAFTVVVTPVEPEVWRDTVTVRGRTEAARKVTVRAETPGAIAETPVAQGTKVKKGDVLCRLKIDARRAGVAEARASRKRAQLDYNAAAQLAKEGFRSETSLAAFKAALDLAIAAEEQARLELARTEISAPFDGIFDNRAVEVGDYLRVGDACGVVMQPSPFLVTGSVSERDIVKISKGDQGVARLVTGEEVEGTVRFVASVAEPATRTFAVELEVQNVEGTLRDGVTAEFDIFARPRNAFFVPRSALTLDDEGRIGIRTVNADSAVEFNVVELIGEDDKGVWTSGLTGKSDVIIRGQNFVRAGQKVKTASPDDIGNRSGAALLIEENGSTL